MRLVFDQKRRVDMEVKEWQVAEVIPATVVDSPRGIVHIVVPACPADEPEKRRPKMMIRDTRQNNESDE